MTSEIPGMPTISPPTFVPGGFWIRFLAMLIDGAIISIIEWPASLLLVPLWISTPLTWTPGTIPNLSYLIGAMGGSMVIYVVVSLTYHAWFYKNKGSTPGKMLFNLRVVDGGTGNNLSYAQACGRELAKYLSGLALMLGYIMAGIRQDKKALHDLLANTQVLKKI